MLSLVILSRFSLSERLIFLVSSSRSDEIEKRGGFPEEGGLGSRLKGEDSPFDILLCCGVFVSFTFVLKLSRLSFMDDKISLTLDEDSSTDSMRTATFPAVRLGGDDAPTLVGVDDDDRSFLLMGVKRLSVSLAAKSCLAREAAPEDISLSGGIIIVMREKKVKKW